MTSITRREAYLAYIAGTYKATPNSTALNMRQTSAEEWEFER